MPVPIPLESVRRLFERPLLELVHEAATVHREHHDPRQIQRCTLLSIKTGVCSEDCAYCPQSARYSTHVEPERLLSPAEVVEEAQAAAAAGASRFCMGAAWREVKEGDSFETVLEMVRGVAATGMEACVTLGMLTAGQAGRLKEAGLTSYNHNLDTSERFYPEIITTRTYEERLATLRHVREAGLSVCCGGILGMGETVDDRIELLCTLANFDPQPESVPINVLVHIEGTPLADQPPVDPFDVVRSIAAARILMPRSRVRLAAGRLTLSDEAQALCFLAGANSIFFGERLLTTPNPEIDRDLGLLSRLGLDLDPQEDREPARA
ncbi:MAG: biotin synthase BioB [Planctomycetota bacterium]|jgi:biotin synthase